MAELADAHGVRGLLWVLASRGKPVVGLKRRNDMMWSRRAVFRPVVSVHYIFGTKEEYHTIAFWATEIGGNKARPVTNGSRPEVNIKQPKHDGVVNIGRRGRTAPTKET